LIYNGYIATCAFLPPQSGKLRIFWELTRECNLRCIHCCTNSGHKVQNYGKEYFKTIIDKLGSYEVEEVFLTGGEPLIVRSIFEIITELKNYGYKVSMSTNGTLLSAKIASILSQIGCDGVHVSVDGATKKTHDWFRGYNGAFFKAMRALDYLKNEGIQTTISCILHKKNTNEIEEVVKIGIEKDCKTITFYPLLPIGRGRQSASLCLNPKDLSILSSKLRNLRDKYINDIQVEYIWMTDSHELGPLEDCYASKVTVITPEGDFAACPWLYKVDKRFIFGNLLTGDIAHLHRRMVDYIDKIKKVRYSKLRLCKSCPYNQKCGRGCLMMTKLKFDNYYVNDPLCSLIRRGEINDRVT